MRGTASTTLQSESMSRLQHMDTFVLNEEATVKGLELACTWAFREETRIFRALSNPAPVPDGAFLACWSFFPLLLETHRSLLRRIRAVLDEDSAQQPQRVLAILVDTLPHITSVHQAYAVQFQAATRDSPHHSIRPDLLEKLKCPLTALDAFRQCLHVLHTTATDIPASSTVVALMDDGVQNPFESMRLRHSQQLDIEDKLPHINWKSRVLVHVSMSVQVPANDELVDANLCLFEGIMVAQSASDGSILAVLEDDAPIAIVPSTASMKCLVVLGSVTSCQAIFPSTDASGAWVSALDKCFQVRRQSAFSFDLHGLLASMQHFPKSWLVADTETANHDLVASAAMWLVDPNQAATPRLHQVYLMRDMVLYGRIAALSECRFVGYILSEHVQVHDPPVAGQHHPDLDNPLELGVAQPDGEAVRLLVAPVDASVRQDWVVHFQRLREAVAVPASDESEDLYVASPSAASSHTTMATSSSNVKGLSSSASKCTDKEASLDSVGGAVSKQLPAARMLQINDVVGSPATSETEIESGDDGDEVLADDADSLDSMLCTKNPKKRSFAQIHSPPMHEDHRVESDELDDTFCAETPDAKDDPPTSPPVPRTLGDGGGRSPPSKRAITFVTDPVDDNVRSTASLVPSTQDMEGGAIWFLAARQSPTPAVPTPSPPVKKATKRGRPKKQPKTPTTATPTIADDSTRSTPTAAATISMSTPLADLPPSTQEMEGGAIQFLRDVPFAAKAVATEDKQPTATPSVARIRIALTGFSAPDALIAKIAAIRNADYEDDVTRASHVVAPFGVIKRTVKILCGISCCSHILDEKWLHASAKLGHAAPEEAYCLSDPVKEALWGCSLRATMYGHTLAQRRSLLRGRAFYITRHKTVLPPPEDLERIIACAGGEMHGVSEIGSNTLVITSVEAVAAASVQKILKRVDSTQCYTPELLLRCILTQTLSLAEYHVGLPDRHEKKVKSSRKKT